MAVLQGYWEVLEEEKVDAVALQGRSSTIAERTELPQESARSILKALEGKMVAAEVTAQGKLWRLNWELFSKACLGFALLNFLVTIESLLMILYRSFTN